MSLSQKSRDKLNTCDEQLVKLVREMAKEMDLVVLCGFRGEKEQTEAFNKGNSKLQFPNSKHNKLPSLAVDIAPSPIDWNNLGMFLKMVQLAKVKAKELNINIRCGADFTSLKDYPHVELI